MALTCRWRCGAAVLVGLVLLAGCGSPAAAPPPQAPAASQGGSAGGSATGSAGGSAGGAPAQGTRPAAAPAAAPGAVKISVAVPAYNMALSPVFLAEKDGYYAKQGLQVSVARLNGSTVTSAALESGDIQFEVTGAAPFLLSVAKTMPFVALGPIDHGFTSQVVASNRYLAKHPIASGASLTQRIALLSGATLAEVSTTDLATMTYLLQYAHLPSTAVKEVKVGNQVAAVAALQQGEVDAVVLSPPQSFAAQAAGYATVLLNTRDIPALGNLPYDVAATTRAYAAAHPATVRAFMVALEEAMAAVAARSPAVLAYEQTVYPTVSPAVVKQTLDFIRLTPYQPMTQAQWGNLTQFLLASGQLSKPYTPKEGVDWTNAFLPAAK